MKALKTLLISAALLLGCSLAQAQTQKVDALTAQKELMLAKINAEGIRITALVDLAKGTDDQFGKGLLAGIIASSGKAAEADIEINVPQERDWLDRTLQVANAFLPWIQVRQNYQLQKEAGRQSLEKYKYTLDSQQRATDSAFDFANRVNEKKPEYVILPAGGTLASEPAPAAPVDEVEPGGGV
jgi:hypothetical protein